MNKNNKRAEKASGAVLAGLCVWLATLAAGAGEPKVVLDVPLDGSADAAFAADGCGKGSYTTVRYAAGKAGQGAEFGSTALPCGLVFAAERLLDKSSGTLELWYKPRWSGSDAGQARPRRTLACSDAARRQPGRLWLTTGWGSIQFGIDVATGKRATVSLSAKTLRAGSWHHIVATWDCNDGVRLVLDGRLVSAKGATWGRVPVSRHLFFGRDERGTT